MKIKAFIIVYTKESKPWSDYPDFNVPRALMILRHDGKLGFPGGSGEQDEQPIETALREMEEEMGVVLQPHDLKSHSVFTTPGGTQIYSFTHETTLEKMQEYAVGINSPEVAGSVLVHLANYPNGGTNTFLKNQFAGTAKKELEKLISQIV